MLHKDQISREKVVLKISIIPLEFVLYVSVHTIDFCYQKHDHPNFNKHKSSMKSSHLKHNESPQHVTMFLFLKLNMRN